MSDTIKFQFSITEKAAILYYLTGGQKVDAYKIAKNKVGEKNTAALQSSAAHFFKSKKGQALMSITISELRNNIGMLIERAELKNFIQNQNYNQNKYDPGDIDSIADIDKDQAIAIVTNIINTNQSDPKTIKELMPRLIELKNWKTEIKKEQSNIVEYHLPKYQ